MRELAITDIGNWSVNGLNSHPYSNILFGWWLDDSSLSPFFSCREETIGTIKNYGHEHKNKVLLIKSFRPDDMDRFRKQLENMLNYVGRTLGMREGSEAFRPTYNSKELKHLTAIRLSLDWTFSPVMISLCCQLIKQLITKRYESRDIGKFTRQWRKLLPSLQDRLGASFIAYKKINKLFGLPRSKHLLKDTIREFGIRSFYVGNCRKINSLKAVKKYENYNTA